MECPQIYSTDVDVVWLLAAWHEVKPQRPWYQYVTGLRACAQIVGQSYARRHDGMEFNSIPSIQLADARGMSYYNSRYINRLQLNFMPFGQEP